MNFRVIEKEEYVDFENFKDHYFNTNLTNNDIKKLLGMGHTSYTNYVKKVIRETGYTRVGGRKIRIKKIN